MPKKKILVLNALIAISREGEHDCRRAAHAAANPHLKSLLTSRANAFALAAQELQACLLELGQVPEAMPVAACRVGVGKQRSDRAILHAVSKGEQAVQRRYARALRAHVLGSRLRAVVRRQYRGVQVSHELFRVLREQYRAQAARA
ncbi:PA2169 family four-helix-bundle protein [Cupriavidus consociatus]|uniref:PA2169 family four-helix-bundle protein n=1 Tax=Cupriavidus consociatus TaxID=2821357 RepID=UPI001AE43629|nr:MULTISPECIES: PA2169 family four-helix-bundle protein [unclassified Cupriavidus]MBP0619561.1 PA2169 family four-helix-bundle protein [Cupriavidus sp. LEh25]MDK2656211.1 PA2169 family four-helix-bundle protein [Cupriavidus sp. LEh21]